MTLSRWYVATTDVQLNDRWAVGGYYQLEWRKTLIPSAGSYFSDADLLDAGGERIRDAGTGMYFYRKEDIEARDQGQFGLKLRYRAEEINTDFGFYAANYHDKAPTVVYVQPLKNSNFGAGKLDRVKKSLWVTLGMGVVYTILTGVLLLAFQDPIMHLFTHEEDVVAFGCTAMHYFCPFYWELSILHSLACRAIPSRNSARLSRISVPTITPRSTWKTR